MLILWSILILILSGILIFLIYASAYIGSNVYIRTICKKETRQKEIILTFDDGVDPINTPKILDILKEQHIKAYFFLIGSKAAAFPEIVKRISADGHYIGIHSYDHRSYFPLQSTHKILKELSDTKNLLEHITGKEINLFRPPFGVTNPHIASAVKRLGLQTIGWNIRSLDTINHDNKKILNKIHNKLVPGSIILLHDRLNGSDILLSKIIVLLNEKNYQFSTL